MKISVKTRYGTAAMIALARDYSTAERASIIKLSDKLEVSKIYMEQVFSLLKRAELVSSIKGAQGGYRLAKSPEDISVYDIFSALELSLLEKTGATVAQSESSIEAAMQDLVFNKLDETVKTFLSSITLADLVAESERHNSEDRYMYYL